MRVYGHPHSPWVQAVLLGLHDRGIAYSLQHTLPISTFLRVGVMMPAAQKGDAKWEMESSAILESAGYQPMSKSQMRDIQKAWMGLGHRLDSKALFWRNFSLTGQTQGSISRRVASNFLRSFITLYFIVLLSLLRLSGKLPRPKDDGKQFLAFEEILRARDLPFLSGEAPDSLDFQLFGMVQSHCSTLVPPVKAFQTDPRLEQLRG